MKNKYLLGLLLVATLPAASATGSAGSSGNVDYYHMQQASLVGIVSAGDVELFMSYPKTVGRSDTRYNVGLTVTYPTVLAPGGMTFGLANVVNTIGCLQEPIAFTAPPATGGSISLYFVMDMQSPSCTGVLFIRLQVGSAVLQEVAMPFTTTANEPLLGGTLDNQNRLCAASEFATSCTAPSLDASGDTPAGQNILSSAWLPLYLGIAVLFIATMREKPNYLAVICAGAFLAYAAYKSPFAAQELKVAVALFGGYNIILGIAQLLEKNPKNDMEE